MPLTKSFSEVVALKILEPTLSSSPRPVHRYKGLPSIHFSADEVNRIGFPLKMDSAMSHGLRPSIVRLCIETFGHDQKDCILVVESHDVTSKVDTTSSRPLGVASKRWTPKKNFTV